MEDNYEAIRRLAEATNQMDGSYYLIARNLGINENTLAVLYALDDGKTHTQSQIAEDWLIPKTTVNTIVKELVQINCVCYTAGNNAREKAICLTETGKKYAYECLKKVYNAEQLALSETLQKYPVEFIEAFEYFSDRLRLACKKEFQNTN